MTKLEPNASLAKCEALVRELNEIAQLLIPDGSGNQLYPDQIWGLVEPLILQSPAIIAELEAEVMYNDPMLTPEEEAELVERINGNWYLQPNLPSESDEALIVELCAAYSRVFCEQADDVKDLPDVMRRGILPITTRDDAAWFAASDELGRSIGLPFTTT